ncbi:MAG TPA: hypothetical protein VNT75_24215 [Symbiobacteriaceae bacterium]|nr:hypothetical protein [Symbiobacteriaceae bacterium]
MYWIDLAVGATYRLRHELEVRDEKTGTLKVHLRAGSTILVRRIEAELDHVYVEGISLPLRMSALRRMVQPAGA